MHGDCGFWLGLFITALQVRSGCGSRAARAAAVQRVINSLSPRRVSVKLVSNSKARRRGEDDSEKFKGSVGTGGRGGFG